MPGPESSLSKQFSDRYFPNRTLFWPVISWLLKDVEKCLNIFAWYIFSGISKSEILDPLNVWSYWGSLYTKTSIPNNNAHTFLILLYSTCHYGPRQDLNTDLYNEGKEPRYLNSFCYYIRVKERFILFDLEVLVWKLIVSQQSTQKASRWTFRRRAVFKTFKYRWLWIKHHSWCFRFLDILIGKHALLHAKKFFRKIIL